jgi:hypothetical protein
VVNGTKQLPELGWNVSGYIAHMRDNTRIWAERVIAVARGADARVVPYDADLLAKARHYNDVALQGARWSLRIAVESWLSAVEEAESTEASCCTPNVGPWVSQTSLRRTLTTLITTAGIGRGFFTCAERTP